MLARLALTWVFNTVALFVATWLLAGLSYGKEGVALLLAALVFTLVNFAIKPALAFLSIPFILATLGIAYFLLNVLMLYLTSWIVAQFQIDTFWWAALAAIVVSAVNWMLHVVFGKPRDLTARRREPGRRALM